MSSTQSLVVNRMKHSPASGLDGTVLSHIILTINVTGSAPEGGEKAAAKAAINDGVGVGPEFQNGRETHNNGAGFDSLAMIGQAIWPDVYDLNDISTRMSERARRLQGYPNPSGEAYFPALLCVVCGGSKFDTATGEIRGRASIFRATLVNRAVLTAMPHSQVEAIAGAEFTTVTATGRQKAGRRKATARSKGTIGWIGKWDIDQAWAMSVTGLVEQEMAKHIAVSVRTAVEGHRTQHGIAPTKGWIAATTAAITAATDTTRKTRTAEATTYMARARREQETLSAAALRLERWHPGFAPTPRETPTMPATTAAPTTTVTPPTVMPALAAIVLPPRPAPYVRPAPPTPAAVRKPGELEPCDWAAGVLPVVTVETVQAAELKYGKPFSSGRGKIVDELIAAWWEEHGKAALQSQAQIRPVIADAIWPGGANLTEEQVVWVGHRLAHSQRKWSATSVRIEMKNWAASAEKIHDDAMSRLEGSGHVWRGWDGNPVADDAAAAADSTH